MPLPVVILPGYFASATEYQALEKLLIQQGIPTTTVPLGKRDWIPTLGGRSVVPILRKIDDTVKLMQQQHNTSQVNLVGHSAGGWIARIYLGEKPYDIHGDVMGLEAVWQAHPYIANLITLGTPHTSQERWTKRNLEFVNHNYSGAFHSQVRYVCVAGKAIYGEKRWGRWLAYNSYKLTCGEGNCWGDGIIPIAAAHLKGAINITLDDVMHSPNSPGTWYGSPQVLSAWLSYLTT